MTESLTSLIVPGPAEAYFAVQPVSLDAERSESTVVGGEWLRDTVVPVSRGALAVALDDATGYVIAAGAPKGRWPVSLGMRLDFVNDPPADGSVLSVVAELVGRDATGGTTRGEVRDPVGGVIALVTQRSHLVDGGPPHDRPAFDPATIVRPEGTLTEQFGIVDGPPDVLELPPSPAVRNVLGNAHGGILVCVSELAAMRALRSEGDLRTVSIDMAYPRPCPIDVPLTFRSTVVHSGRSMQLVHVVVSGPGGKPGAVATVTTTRVPA